MHLLAREAGAAQQEGEAIDLGQAPGDIVFASAADSELTMLAAAADRAGEDGLRLASILRLQHNLSVDTWIANTARHARLIVVRLLGGPAYWPYGVDELSAVAAAEHIPLALLPGDGNPDPILRNRSSIAGPDWDRLHALFIAGGPENFDRLLAFLQAFATSTPRRKTGDGLGRLTRVPAAGTSHPTSKGEEPGRAGGEDVAIAFPRFGYWRPGHSISAPPILPPEDRPGEGTDRPIVPILFYRAVLEGAGAATVEALIAECGRRNLVPLPLVVSSLKDAACAEFVRHALAAYPPAVILNLTGFSLGLAELPEAHDPFAGIDAPVVQLVQAGRPEAQWQADSQGLSPRDLAMQIVLPELDGRIGGLIVGHKQEAVWHERTQCPLTQYVPDRNGVRRAAALATNWARLRATPRAERRIGIVLANYPIRDGRLANGVGYDAPQSTVEILNVLDKAGYRLAEPSHRPVQEKVDRAHAEADERVPANGNALIERLQAGPTNAHPERAGGIAFSLSRYRDLFATLPGKVRSEVTARWGDPADDPFVKATPSALGGEGGTSDEHLAFRLPAIRLGNITILLQPSRGYDLDETASYHDPDLVPPHAYCAAYLWLRHDFAAHALIHNGKHGNLEWLPGKAVALDAASYPAALWAELPHLYPFIVNDPGEGTQAKRRAGAVIIDHLVPPLTRAETYGPLKDLEALLDEYYAASGLDRRRLVDLRRRILAFARDERLDRDVTLPADETEALKALDTFLCDLKEAQIRDGLHIFGQSPTGRLERDLIVALARVPRGEGPGEASLIRALADDLGLGVDPLTADMGADWAGPVPKALRFEPDVTIRTIGDVVERLEILAARLVEAAMPVPEDWTATRAVLHTIETTIRPRLAASGANEIRALIDGLDGKFIAPGPSGAPSRGRLDVLPTGRNFYSVDNRAVPTPTAWELGGRSAENLLARHFQDHGTYPRALALSVWGTANMRTGGDDIAQALALIGARPVWDPGSLRVSGYEIVPLAKLGRPRVDVTLRISGLFRDAFPMQIALFDRAIRAIGALDEPEDDNPVAARMRTEALGLMAEGAGEAEAAERAGYRIFGSKPGAYGAGLQGLMDSSRWRETADLAEAFLEWGQYAYGARADGVADRNRFAARLGAVEAVVHNQDNREHDIFDSDDYYQFEGGLAATAETLSGRKPAIWHNDHSRPERPLTRSLQEEVSRVVRSRVVNPKWITGVKRHGYKGAFEIIATVDYMFAFAATTGAVKTHHFDLAFAAFVEDEATREFIKANNRYGYDELLAKFDEAIRRGFWTPRSNSAYAFLEERTN